MGRLARDSGSQETEGYCDSIYGASPLHFLVMHIVASSDATGGASRSAAGGIAATIVRRAAVRGQPARPVHAYTVMGAEEVWSPPITQPRP